MRYTLRRERLEEELDGNHRSNCPIRRFVNRKGLPLSCLANRDLFIRKSAEVASLAGISTSHSLSKTFVSQKRDTSTRLSKATPSLHSTAVYLSRAPEGVSGVCRVHVVAVFRVLTLRTHVMYPVASDSNHVRMYTMYLSFALRADCAVALSDAVGVANDGELFRV